jgi:hypothetical protein
MPISQDGILYENEAQLLLNQPVEAPTKVTVRPSTTVPPSNEPQGFSDESGRPAMDPYDILDLPKMNPTESNYPMGIEYDPELRATDEDGNFLEEYQIEKFPSEISAAKRNTISLDDPLPTEASTEPAEATSGGTPVEWLPIIDQAVKTIAGMTPVGLIQQVGESSLKHALGSVLKATGTLKRIMDGEVPANSDEGIAAITEIAGLYGGGGLATAPLRPGIGTFGGVSRLMKNKLPEEAGVAAQKALKLQKEGKSSQSIWEETGWYKDPRDEKWKFEIPDRGMQAKSVEIPEGELIHVGEKPSVYKFKPDSSVLLSEVIEHPLLFKIYPELKEVNVFVDKTMQPREAGAWERYKTIGISPEVAKALGENSLQARAVILHEIQHLIQNIEHFGKGGSPSQFKKKTPDEAYEAYMALPGEIESRNVADRFVIDTLRPYNNPRKYVPVPYQ